MTATELAIQNSNILKTHSCEFPLNIQIRISRIFCPSFNLFPKNKLASEKYFK